ncbi:hypothetical protein LguiB_024510 [Lonicera macranthoides]
MSCLRLSGFFMASSSVSAEDLKRDYVNFAPNDEEENGLVFEGAVGNNASDLDFRWCLVGCLLTEKPINFVAMRNTFASL